MSSVLQHSISEYTLNGIGIHTGQKINVSFFPALCGAGITFVRTDLPGKPRIPACHKNIISTHLATTLGKTGGPCISTIEHLMSALWAHDIQDLDVHVDGPEIPILDGSALPWYALLTRWKQDTIYKKSQRHVLRPQKTLEVRTKNSWLQAKPAQNFSITMTVPLSQSVAHTFSFKPCQQAFETEIAPARTFAFYKDITRMRDMGMIRGGTEDNALVIHDGFPITSQNLRMPNECARHKILDLIGDWSLAGQDYTFGVHVTGYASGHTLNRRLLEKMLQQPVATKQHTTLPTSHRLLRKYLPISDNKHNLLHHL